MMIREKIIQIVLSLLISLSVVAGGLIVRKKILETLQLKIYRKYPQILLLFLDSMSIPSLYWIIALGLYVFVEMSPLPPRLSSYGIMGLKGFLILSVTLVAADLLPKLALHGAQKIDFPHPIPAFLPTGMKTMILTVGFLILLGSLGISVFPLVVVLGIGSLAFFLSLQDSLSNLFSGLHILFAGLVRAGDYIKLESGEEGHVTGIGWLTTQVKRPDADLVIVPNKRLTQMIVTAKKAGEAVWDRRKIQQVLSQHLADRQVLVVSNREPYIHTKTEGIIRCEAAAGGLVTALDPVMETVGGVWIAWGSGPADREMTDESGRVRVPPDNPTYFLKRIFLDEEEVEGYYNGYSNSFLWPLCHTSLDRVNFKENFWEAYKRVNEQFARAVCEEIRGEKPIVWIHDYHLALLPLLLREKRPDLVIAYFWHIPWPPYDVFRIAPQRRELLEALLACDLVGFQLEMFRKNFLGCLQNVLHQRVTFSPETVRWKNRPIRIKTFPISVDYEKLCSLATAPEMEKRVEEVKQKLHLPTDGFVGVGVDRLDYTKALVERFQALDLFFTRYPHFQGKFTFVQIAPPSRTDVEAYRSYQELVEKTVQTVNRRHAREEWKPIEYLPRHLDQEELVVYYRAADLAIVSSASDGMNLVAKEFIAAQVEEKGSLLLSELAGASEEIEGAFLINPYDTEGVCEMIRTALGMPPSVKKALIRKMRENLRENTIYKWVGTILMEMAGTC